jgi:hypothetical protein
VLKISQAALIAATLGLGSWSLAAGAALAQDSSSEMASMDMGASSAEPSTATTVSTSITVQSVATVGSNMDEGAIRDALTGGFAKHADEIAKLTAASIIIPEIDIAATSTDSTPKSVTVALKDVSLTNVKDGVAGSFSLGSIEAKSEEGTFNFGKVSAANVDFHALLGTFGYVPLGSSSDPMKVIYQDVSFDGGSITSPQVKCTIGKATFGQSQTRPLKISYADALKAMPKDGEPSADSIDTLVRYYADALKASIGGPFDFDGLSCAGQDGSNKPFELTVGKVHVDASTTPGTTAPSTVEGIKIVGDGSTVTLAMLGLKAIDFNPAIAAVEAETSKITADWLMQNYRKLVPSFGGFSFSGLGVNGFDSETPPSPIDVKVANFDLTMSDYLNGIPTKLSSTGSGIEVPLPADSSDDQVKMLLALGIDRVNLGFDLSAAWDKATQTVNVDKVAINGKDLGSVAVAAVIGNAAEQLFDVNPDVMQAASLGVTLKSLKLDLSDAGVGDKIVPMFAGQQNMDAATFRSQIAGMAAGTALQLVGATDAGKALSDALASFLTGTTKALNVTITSKDPAGIAVPVLMQAGDDPTVLSSAVTITGASQ